jgi:hypothetical protein
MVTVLAILTGILAVLAIVSSAIRTLLACIPPMGWLILVCVLGGWYLGSSGGCNLGCQERERILPIPRVLPRPRFRETEPEILIPVPEEMSCWKL